MLLAIADLTLKMWFIAGHFVLAGAIIALGDLILYQVEPRERRPATVRLMWSRYVQITETVATALIRLLLEFFLNRTALIGFTIFIGAQALAAAEPSRTSECAAVIAMSLLWITADMTMRGFTVGVSMFKYDNEVPLHRKIANSIHDLVRTYTAIPGRIASRLKAA